MKKLLMLFFICLFTSSLFAQVKYAEVYKKQLKNDVYQKLIEGNLDFLQTERNLKIILDFSQADINGATAEQFIDVIPLESESLDNEEKGWNKKTLNNDVLRYEFVNNINQALSQHRSGLRIVNNLDSKYKATVYIISVNRKGGIKGIIDFTPNDSDKSLAKVTFSHSGGSHGSISNLMGDALKEAGENLGAFIARKAR